LEKKYKNKEGTYEQIFFKTQGGIASHRSKSRVALRPIALPLSVAIDSAERYPWKFPRASVERRKLPAGDYALIVQDRVQAVVERKTFENLLKDFSQIAILHQKLRELATFPYAAVVIEAAYGDFLDPKRLKGKYPPSHGYRVLAELQVMHPRLPFIFARTRKEANLWTYGFFRAILKRLNREAEMADTSLLAADPIQSYTAPERLEDRILRLLEGTLAGHTIEELLAQCPEVDKDRLRKLLLNLQKRGVVQSTGKGKDRRWIYSRGRQERIGEKGAYGEFNNNEGKDNNES